MRKFFQIGLFVLGITCLASCGYTQNAHVTVFHPDGTKTEYDHVTAIVNTDDSGDLDLYGNFGHIEIVHQQYQITPED